jgi:hypothetical protein
MRYLLPSSNSTWLAGTSSELQAMFGKKPEGNGFFHQVPPIVQSDKK